MLYEVTLNARYAGQQCINRWNYQSNDVSVASGGSLALLSAMGFVLEGSPLAPPADTVFGKINDLVSSAVLFDQVIARAIYDDTDFMDLPFIPPYQTSVSNGVAQAPFYAFGFFTSRVNQSIRRGFKRLVGVGASDITSLGEIVSGTQTKLQDLATAMNETISFTEGGSTVTFTPTIVQKEPYTVTGSGKTAYRYYASQATQLDHIAQGFVWSFYDTVRSQTSRQYGKGI